ncbi:MAG: hypothetical protein HRU40_01805 [Saprospiraceae bacterium]|nr:hypothetical protein [Saprospiraceae bacterium]
MNTHLRLWGLLLLLFPFFGVSQPLTSETFNGLYIRNIGPAAMSGRIVDLAVVEQDMKTFYVASATGGVWKTTNNGTTFNPVFENEATHSVGDVAVHQVHPHHVWVGTGERANRQSSSWGDGVYKSTDGGESWTNMGLKETHHIGRIVVHPQDTNTVYVAGMGHLWGPNEERGLYKTTDGGVSWDKILYIDDETGVVDIAMDPSDPEILYTATYQRQRRPFGFHGGGPGSGLYKSVDGGKTWNELRNGLPEGTFGRIGISIYRTDPNVVYVCVEQGYQYNASTAYNGRRAGIYRSEDKGESFTFMSDWNPRPMYASQILVDPLDDQRIYMMNQYSYSDDGGKTFTRPRQSLHGDDRFFWVNPTDSRHVMKADDGGLGISYDRGITWKYSTNLPLSQFYRVSVDMRTPYWVYGGLQDNGSWMGPSETFRSEGILNADWIKTGGGDGFLNLIKPDEPHKLYVESQYLGLSVLDLETGQRRDIRPGDPKGRIRPRRNWDAWGPGVAEPEIGNAKAPANWDGPFFFSAHDPNKLYAGTNIFWKSTDGGDTWQACGDLTTQTNRRELEIMGQRPDTSTHSLDDGIPYWPTLTAIAESKGIPGHLYAGTDDGKIQVSTDDGAHWMDVTPNIPGLPEMAWINTIEVSSHHGATAFLAINNYRNDDYSNYLYKTTDGGVTWSSITGDLPANRVVRTLREDPRNPNIYYLGTELGLFVSINGGQNWVELKANMPTLPFNDLVIHPRDNDLILGTHGRGIWILDNLNPIQELTPQVMAQDAALFSIPDAELIQEQRQGSHRGDMFYRGENPQRGVMIDFYLREDVPVDAVSLSIQSMEGKTINTIRIDTTAGLHRVYWNGRYKNFMSPYQNPGSESSRWSRRGPNGPLANPGLYQAVLSVHDKVFRQTFRMSDDPRISIDISDRTDWVENQFEVGALYEGIVGDMKGILPLKVKLDTLMMQHTNMDNSLLDEMNEMQRMYTELLSRTSSLLRAVGNWMGPMTDDQHSRLDYYRTVRTQLATRTNRIKEVMIPKLNKKLKKDERILLEDITRQ